MEKRMLYKNEKFYLLLAALAVVITAIALYAGNCGSEFNGEVVSPQVLTGYIIALVVVTIALAGEVLDCFIGEGVLSEIFSYRRFLLYIAFVALLYGMFMSILAEYSLIGTVLYPLVSGTVGDPVDPVLWGSYIAQFVCALAAAVLTIIVALRQKSDLYKAKKAAAYEPIAGV